LGQEAPEEAQDEPARLCEAGGGIRSIDLRLGDRPLPAAAPRAGILAKAARHGRARAEGAAWYRSVERAQEAEARGGQARSSSEARSQEEVTPPMADLHDLVRRQFGLNAQRYVESYDHAKGESLERMVEVVDPRPDWTVLDIATGGGHTALEFAP